MVDYSPEKIWPFFERLPGSLREAIFSEDIIETIEKICQKNKIENKVTELAKKVGFVFLGFLHPDDFEGMLRKELNLDSILAKKINLEISQLLFLPFKEDLEKIYKTKVLNFLTEKNQKEESAEIQPKLKEKTHFEDIYREPIE